MQAEPETRLYSCSPYPLQAIIDGDPVPTFVIDANHVITHWNKACEAILGSRAAAMVGTRRQWQPFYSEARPVLADLMVDGAPETELEAYYGEKCRPSPCVPGAYEVEEFFPHLGEGGRWLQFTAAPICGQDGQVVGAIETLQDTTERRRAEIALRQTQAELASQVAQRTAQLSAAKLQLESDIARREKTESELLKRYAELTELNIKLSDTNRQLEEAHKQLLQAEKMASMGQLAAGVAHEINNPVGYVQSNLGALEGYIDNLLAIIAAHEAAESDRAPPECVAEIKRRVDFDYLKDDIPAVMHEIKEGVGRVRKIVQDLKDFSRAEQVQEWQWSNIHTGLDSTLNIVNNEIKYKADVVKEYGDLPAIQCLPSQLNQVFLNLLVNAAHAIDGKRGTITIRSGSEGDRIWVEIADTGCGIPEDLRSRIFEPFFTTKPAGKGTGLGLSVSYGIVKKHQGCIEVQSAAGKGTTFRVTLPVTQPEPAPA